MSDPVVSTMQDAQLTITEPAAARADGLRRQRRADLRRRPASARRRTPQVGERAARLAGALAGLGVQQGDRVGTFLWNTQEHLEAYFAVPSMGAVLHTLNLRLFPEQLAYVIDHGQDRVVIVDATVLPLLAKVADQIPTVEHYVLVGRGRHQRARRRAGLTATRTCSRRRRRRTTGPSWTSARRWRCATRAARPATPRASSTATARPGCTRSRNLSGNVLGLTEHDSVLPVVPMFHANAWGLPYAGWMAGTDFVLPGRFLQAEPLARMISELRPTMAGAVPTIWNDLLSYVDEHETDLSSLRLVTCGGSAVPLGLMQRFERDHGVHIVQAWGMTETSPVASISHVPKGAPEDEEWTWRSKTGRVMAGVEMRLVDDSGTVLPWDGEAVGEMQVRGPWITGAYHRDPDPEKFMDGWLRTGDVATCLPNGFTQITDRSKDVIKSGGEWISSVELEGTLMGHPSVFEAAVVAVPDEKWDERPLACVVLRPDAQATPDELKDFLGDKVARWWLPERWTFIEAVPEDQRRQVRQEGAAQAVRRRPARRPGPRRLVRTVVRIHSTRVLWTRGCLPDRHV